MLRLISNKRLSCLQTPIRNVVLQRFSSTLASPRLHKDWIDFKKANYEGSVRHTINKFQEVLNNKSIKENDDKCKKYLQKLKEERQYVSLEKCNLEDTFINYFSNVMNKHSSLIRLNLSNNEISSANCDVLFESLKHHKSLQTLDISRNNIGDKGCIALSKELNFYTSLEILNISYNNISFKGLIALAEALKTNTSLVKLNLNCNNIDDDWCKILFEVLHNHPSIKRLHVIYPNNGLSSVGHHYLRQLKKEIIVEDFWYNCI